MFAKNNLYFESKRKKYYHVIKAYTKLFIYISYSKSLHFQYIFMI